MPEACSWAPAATWPTASFNPEIMFTNACPTSSLADLQGNNLVGGTKNKPSQFYSGRGIVQWGIASMAGLAGADL